MTSALQGKSATVTQSSLLLNRDSENHEEIDVLIEFKQGLETYRTGVACRDHGRKASPGWIRDLAVQRDAMGLTRMIAVHSRGFSGPAVKQAKSLNIDTLTLKAASAKDVHYWADFPHRMMTTSARARLLGCITINTDEYDAPQQLPVAILVDDKELSQVQFENALSECLREWALREMEGVTETPTLPDEREETRVLRYRIEPLVDMYMKTSRGDRVQIKNICGHAVANIRLHYMLHKDIRVADDRAVLTVSDQYLGHSYDLTAVVDRQGVLYGPHMDIKEGIVVECRLADEVARKPPSNMSVFAAWCVIRPQPSAALRGTFRRVVAGARQIKRQELLD